MSIADQDPDVRCAAVVWTDDWPRIQLTGCSTYEAIGLLIAGAIRLAISGPALLDEDDDVDE